MQWVDSRGNPIVVSNEMTARGLEYKVTRVKRGKVNEDVHELPFRDANHSRAGKLHAQHSFWESVAELCPPLLPQLQKPDVNYI